MAGILPAFRNWKKISPESARLRPLYGMKGWLLVLLILWAFVEVIGLTELGRLNTIEVILLFLDVAALILAVLKHRIFPMAALIALGLDLSYFLVFIALVESYRTGYWAISGDVFAILVALAMITYLLRSRRVNVTYLHRVPIDEPDWLPSDDAEKDSPNPAP